MNGQSECAEMNNNRCGNCRWITDCNGYFKCNNPSGNFYQRPIAKEYTACTTYEFNGQDDCKDPLITDVVINNSSESVINFQAERTDEQYSKNIAVSRVEVEYTSDRSVIHAIINAISVRINMPRGTVKALMACLAVLLIAVAMMAFHSKEADLNTADSEADTSSAGREYAVEEGNAVNSERTANTLDYVIISSHYRYVLPENLIGVWEPTDCYAENETFCDFTCSDNEYTIRSYLLDFSDGDLADVVKADLSQFDNMKFLDEQMIDSEYGDMLKIKFESTDERGEYTAGIGYYWYESEPKICCLEISSDDWYDDEIDEKVLDSVYRIKTNNNMPPPSDAEEIWQEQQKEEAMNSLVEDAMNDYYEPEPDYDPLF